MWKRIIATTMSLVLLFTGIAYGHSGGLDKYGGHRDNNNVSGLGYYHYHCWGHPPHLHNNGRCPYDTPVTFTPNISQNTASVSKSKPVEKIQLKKPTIEVKGYESCIKVSWNSINHAEKYSVYRATSKDGEYKKIATTEKCYYKDTSAKVGKRYYYKVKAFGSGRYTRSYYSKPASAKRIDATLPRIITSKDSIEIEDGSTKSITVIAKNSKEDIVVTWYEDWVKLEWGESVYGEDGWEYELLITIADGWKHKGESDSLCFAFANDEDNCLAIVDVFVG